jgi:uncharacterized protein YndB with AHSA1/START domain
MSSEKTKPDFVYATYIATTPEKLWQALIDPELTRRYWIDPTSDDPGHVNVSDWQPGSSWQHQRQDADRTIDIVGKVVESMPPSRLVLSWARPKDADDATRHSRVTFAIEPKGDGLVRLIVTHDGLDPQMLAGISNGWPTIISNLKTLLETGRGLPKQTASA